MKKIFILALVAIFMLPVLPAIAAEYTTVTIADSNSIDTDLVVNITASDGFEGAEINVANQVFHSYNGSGAGEHTVNVPLDDLFAEGDVLVTVNALYDGFSEEIAQTVSISKFTLNEKVIDTPLADAKLGFRGLNHVVSNAVVGSIASYPVEEPEYWGVTGYAQIDVTKIDPPLNGIIKYSFDFKPEAVLHHIRVRMTANITNGAAFQYGAKPETHYFLSDKASGTFGSENVEYLIGEWNHVELIYDLYTNTFTAYLNNTLAEVSTIKATAGTNDFVADSRTIFDFENESDIVYLDNFKFEGKEYINSWKCESTNYDGEKISLAFSEDVDGLTATDFKLVNSLGDEVAISSVEAIDGGYEITPAKELLYGSAYKVLVKNGTKSADGFVAYKEAAVDKDGDGFFAVALVKAPKYALNVDYVEDNGDGYNVFFNNTDISDKYVAVCWYGENCELVDFDIKAATEVYSGEYISLYRSNSAEAVHAKVNVFRFDTDTNSDSYGEIDVFEIYNID